MLDLSFVEQLPWYIRLMLKFKKTTDYTLITPSGIIVYKVKKLGSKYYFFDATIQDLGVQLEGPKTTQ